MAESISAAIFTCWVIWPLVAPGRCVASFDVVTYSGPNLALTLDAARHGRLAQWNPFIYGGVSNVGNISAAPLYPIKWLFAWVDPGRAWGLLVAAHVALLGVGMFWLVRRRLHLATPAALVATVAVVGSGTIMVRATFFEQIMVLAWAPWLLGSIDACLAARGPRRNRAIAGLAVVVAFVAIAGHPQMAYVLLPLAAVWTFARALDHHGRSWWRRLGPVLAAAFLGLLLAAPQLLPSMELASRSANTGGRDLATISNPGYSVQLKRLFGTWFGDPLQADHTITAGGYENLTFVGVVVTTLALVALISLVTARRDRAPRWRCTVVGLTLVIVGAMTLAVGPRLAFYRVAFAVVPGFDQARVPGRWVTPAVLATALLAAIGMDRLRRARLGPVTWFATVATALLGAGLMLIGPFTPTPAATLALWLGLATVCLLIMVLPARGAAGAGTVLALLLVVELGLAQRHSFIRGSSGADLVAASPSPSVQWLRDHRDTMGSKIFALTDDQVFDIGALLPSLRPNANVWGALPSPDGYDGGIQATEQWAKAFGPLADGPFHPDGPARGQLAFPIDPEAFARLGVRWVLLDTNKWPAAKALPAWGEPVFHDGNDAIFENPAARGSVQFLAPTANDSSLVALTKLSIQRRSPERVVITYSAPEAGTVVVSEQWDPGWTARLDGTPVEVVPAPPLGLAVATAPGEHRLELTFRAPHLHLGLFLGGFALALVVGLGAEGLTFRRRS